MCACVHVCMCVCASPESGLGALQSVNLSLQLPLLVGRELLCQQLLL